MVEPSQAGAQLATKIKSNKCKERILTLPSTATLTLFGSIVWSNCSRWVSKDGTAKGGKHIHHKCSFSELVLAPLPPPLTTPSRSVWEAESGYWPPAEAFSGVKSISEHI